MTIHPMGLGRVRHGADASAEGGRGTRHLLIAIAHTELELACAAGGLIFDRVSAGWEAEILLAAGGEQRALAILGVSGQDLAPKSLRSTIDRQPDSIVASQDVYAASERVRRHVNAMSRRHIEVVLWGGAAWPPDLGKGLGLVQHQLSIAARAFKGAAIKAAGGPTGIETTDHELYFSGKRRFTAASSWQPR